MDEDLLNSIEEISMGSSEPKHEEHHENHEHHEKHEVPERYGNQSESNHIHVNFGSNSNKSDSDESDYSNEPSEPAVEEEIFAQEEITTQKAPINPTPSHFPEPHKHHKSNKIPTIILSIICVVSLACTGVFAWLYFEQINKPSNPEPSPVAPVNPNFETEITDADLIDTLNTNLATLFYTSSTAATIQLNSADYSDIYFIKNLATPATAEIAPAVVDPIAEPIAEPTTDVTQNPVAPSSPLTRYYFKNRFTKKGDIAYVYISAGMLNSDNGQVYCDVYTPDELMATPELPSCGTPTPALDGTLSFVLDESNSANFASYRLEFIKSVDDTYTFDSVTKQ